MDQGDEEEEEEEEEEEGEEEEEEEDVGGGSPKIGAGLEAARPAPSRHGAENRGWADPLAREQHACLRVSALSPTPLIEWPRTKRSGEWLWDLGCSLEGFPTIQRRSRFFGDRTTCRHQTGSGPLPWAEQTIDAGPHRSWPWLNLIAWSTSSTRDPVDATP
ncbi:unnamed protein product [Prorocentrum cordatum]|uniref:Uncharacterized protein n=1 Tax=Prorocentrum cordatum TaxID=2364126 RepID=A0ABN9USM4_9DINO|nr:unnamed protein product [Polarella glacialis]